MKNLQRTFGQIYAQILCSPQRALSSMQRHRSPAAEKDADARIEQAYQFLIEGWALLYLGRFAESARQIELARSVFQERLDDVALARCDHAWGTLQRFLGQLDEAQAALEHAAGVFRRLNLPQDAARCARDRAILFGLLGRTDVARTCLRQAQELWTGSPQDPEIFLSHCVEGVLLLGEGYHPEALQVLQEAGNNLARPNCTMGEAICRFEEARALDAQDEYAEALNVYQRARTLFGEEGLLHRAAYCDNSEGYLLWRMEHYDQARFMLERAITTFRRMGLDREEAAGQLNLGNLLFSKNRYQEAMVLYQAAHKGYQKVNRVSGMARSLLNQGLIHHLWGEYGRALSLFEETAALLEQINERYALAVAWESMADTQALLGQDDLALAFYERAESVFQESNAPVDAAGCAQGRARLLARQALFGPALEELERARQVFQEKGLLLREAAARVVQGDILAQQGRPAEAGTAYRRARPLFESEGMVLDVARCDLGLAKANLELDETGRSSDHLFERAPAVFGETFPELSWQACAGLARCAQVNGRPERALAHYLEAVEMIRRARSWVPGETWSARFFDQRQQAHQQALDLAVQLKKPQAALQVTESARAQAFLSLLGADTWSPRWTEDAEEDQELLQLRRNLESLRQEIRTFSTGVRQDLLERADPKLAEKRAQLESGMAQYDQLCQQRWTMRRARALRGWTPPFDLESFRRDSSRLCPEGWQALCYDLDQTLTIVHLDAEGEQIWRRPLRAIDRDRLEMHSSTKEGNRAFLYQGDSILGHPLDSGVERDLRRLHELLIPPPVEQRLHPDRPLLLVPHGLLHTLPFAALLGSTGYLVQQSQLVVLPSLQTLSLLAPPVSKSGLAENKPRFILLLGASRFQGRWDDLPAVPAELARIEQVWKNDAHVRTIPDLCRESFDELVRQGLLGQSDLVHLSTHAAVDRGQAWTARIALEDQDLWLRDLLASQINARLVVLSACRAGTGQRYEGEEHVGLAWAFFAVGARALITSLWNVPDHSATILMEHTHTILFQGGRPSAALAQAQRAMIQLGYSPYHWAGFTLQGIP